MVETEERCGLFWRKNADDKSADDAERGRDFPRADRWYICWVVGSVWGIPVDSETECQEI